MDLGDDTLRQMAVKIGSRWFAIQEAHGDAAVAYRRCMMDGAEFEQEQEETGVKIRKVPMGTAELEPVLISQCMFYATYDETKDELVLGERVPEGFVRGLPNRILKPIYKWIKENSDLDEKKNPTKQPTAEQKSSTTGCNLPMSLGSGTIPSS
jgi:hypothetical protein